MSTNNNIVVKTILTHSLCKENCAKIKCCKAMNLRMHNESAIYSPNNVRFLSAVLTT